jgi:hypothetical protein
MLKGMTGQKKSFIFVQRPADPVNLLRVRAREHERIFGPVRFCRLVFLSYCLKPEGS